MADTFETAGIEYEIRGAVGDPVEHIFNETVRFLQRQQRQDGLYGFWMDEERLYRSLGYDPATFDHELVRPVTEACNEVMRAVDLRGADLT